MVRRLPKTVKVALVNYIVKVRKMREVEDGVLNGEILYNDLEIHISEDIALERQIHTFFHELTHAICNEAGLSEHRENEDFIDRFSKVFAQVAIDNGWNITQGG